MKLSRSLKVLISLICVIALVLSINATALTVDAATNSNSVVVNAIIDGLKAFKSRIELTKYNISADDFGDIYLDILYDNPELFHVKTRYSYSMNSATEIVTAVLPVYMVTSAEYNTMAVEFDNVAADYLSYISDDMTEFTKALILHDLLVRRCMYSSDYYMGNTIPDNCYTAYGALVEKEAVCQGYSMAYHYLLDKCGVESDYAISDAMNHVWNLVKIGSSYYHVDATWDDARYSFGGERIDLAGVVQHKYFLLTDTEMENKEHYNWKADYTAASTAYSNSFVRSIANTGVSYYGGYYYYVDGSGVLVKQKQGATSVQTVYQITAGKWSETGVSYKKWSPTNSRVYTVGNNIYFTECKNVMMLNLAKDTESPVIVGTPSLDNDECLYGLEIVNNKGYCDVLNASNTVSCREQFDLLTPSYDFTVTVKDSGGKTLGSSFTGYVGDTVTLTVTSVSGNADTYSVSFSNPDVAKYNATGGKITLTAAGSTTITVKSNTDANCVQTLSLTVSMKKAATPSAPTLQSKTESSVTLNPVSGCEYSMDKVNWQTSNVFNNLTANKDYSFYMRVAATGNVLASDASAALTVRINKAATPSAPTIKTKTENSVTLNPVSGCEYSMDKVNWQTSNVFNNLTANKDYSFYMRVAATGNVLASDASAALTVRINKAATPSAPTLQSKTESSVTLNPVSGCEYSMDKVNWQTSNVFNNLTANKDYSFYMRVAATGNVLASDASAALTVRINKASTPSAPTLQSKTESSVTLNPVSGCEYSMDKVNWQTSNVFNNLESDRDYTFYVRVAATTDVFASDIASITVHLSSTNKVVYGDCNYDGKINLLDLIVIRKHLAKWSISIDQTAADCNGDGKLNLLDLIVMRKYLAKWNIVLGPQK